MKNGIKTLLGVTLLTLPFGSDLALACKGKSMVLNKRDSAVKLCYDHRLKAFLSSDCFSLNDGKACEIRSIISRNRFSPVKLSARELQTAENPDAAACQKLNQRLRVLIDSEGMEHPYCESKYDGSLAPLYLFKWRV
ncbi:MAG: hypothetical protein KGP28_02480 [Bdellovibrionales bacterium]|nr:hypothetical protein [Bdellovibrionales bacterium]